MQMFAGATPAARQVQSRILVVSADPSFRNRFLKELGNSEISVEEALSGAHALARLRSLSFDTLILDRQLPDLNAEEVMDLVRRRFPGVQIRLVDVPGREELPDSGPLVETDIALQPAPPVKNPLVLEVDPLPG